MAEKSKDMAEHLKGSRESKAKPEGGKEGESAKASDKKSKGGERKGHRLHEIRTRFTKSGAAIHEHHYKDENGHTVPDKPEYVSSNMDDLHQHMDDHASPEMEGGGDPGNQPEADGEGAEQDEDQ